MMFRLDTLDEASLDAAARQFEEDGYIMLEGVSEAITSQFIPIVAERLGVGHDEMDTILDPNSPPVILPVEVRQRMSRIDTSPELATGLLSKLDAIISRLIGPVVHVSSNFHGQFKGGDVQAVDHGGYDPKAQYLEVQGQYLIHQDFSGAALPTSPAGITLWTPLNSCPDWNLRIYPGTHRNGLLCHQWLKLDDPRLSAFRAPIDVQAKAGTCVIFNSLLLHSSSNPGPRRRLSCDIRFFPLTGFLPSTPHILGATPLTTLRTQLAKPNGPTLRDPLLEVLAFLGNDVYDAEVPPHSILNWPNYLSVLLSGNAEQALPLMERFVNQIEGWDTPEIYTSKFHNRTVHLSVLSSVRDRLAELEPNAPELTAFEPLAARLAGASV
jgi:Phytanoyl-CoA dioxygenase (PhyH)